MREGAKAEASVLELQQEMLNLRALNFQVDLQKRKASCIV